jgi:nucleoside-diphosphate-sugar epimerase
MAGMSSDPVNAYTRITSLLYRDGSCNDDAFRSNRKGFFMRIFVTGATGFVGSAIVQELIAAGHQVLGLARSDAGARSLEAAGAQVHRGDIENLDSLHVGAARSDGVIHTAFNHDFSTYKANCEADRRAVQALGYALARSSRPLIVTSGFGALQPGHLFTEDLGPAAGSATAPRAATEEAAAEVAALGVHVSVVRLARSVHGEGDHGFVPALIRIAREKGLSAFIGDGLNRWPAVHRLDAARLYRLALEKVAANARYHGVAEEGLPFRDIAGIIGRRLNLPVAGKTPDEAAGHFGWFANFAALDSPASSQHTREQLGWQPTRPGLIADLDGPHYFQG